MPMIALWRVLNMPSVDSDYDAPANRYGAINAAYTVRDVLESKIPSVKLIRAFDRGKRIDPVHIAFGYEIVKDYEITVPDSLMNSLILGNGHHRIKLYWERNVEMVEYSNNILETGDDYRKAYAREAAKLGW